MNVFSKLAGQTTIYGLSVACMVFLIASCSDSQSHDLAGRWRAWLVHGSGEKELVFLDDGTYTNTTVDSTGNRTNDVDRGGYIVAGDSLFLTPQDGSTVSFALQWKNEHKLLLILDSSMIALERYQQ